VRLLYSNDKKDSNRLSSAAGSTTSRWRRHDSYSRLRAEYLKKVHAMHPDKTAHARRRNEDDGEDDKTSSSNNDGKHVNDDHIRFIELKNAWEKYHASVDGGRRDKRYSWNGDCFSADDDDDEDIDDVNFTMFGVGCSFADSPEERDLRDEITEQACRGWFPSGAILSRSPPIVGGSDVGGSDLGDGKHNGGTMMISDDHPRDALCGRDRLQRWERSSSEMASVRLSDDDMFVRCDRGDVDDDDDERPVEKEGGGSMRSSERKFLVKTAAERRFGRRSWRRTTMEGP